MTAHKPATALPINRHFDCMKKCPMDCGTVCKRLAYPKLVDAVAGLMRCYVGERTGKDYADSETGQVVDAVRALLRELGESK